VLTPQFLLPISSELVIDLFAGGGGADAGIEQAIGRHVDIAINHDPEAIALHAANHPQTRHYVSDVSEVSPRVVTAGYPVGLLWASPDCTFHSKARGGKPFRDRNRARRRRGLAWVVCRWAREVRPRVICLENVEEFQHWGPLLDDGTPCSDRRGSTFRRWIAQLENLGYRVEWRELRACDYGAPTIRKRLFLVARCDGLPIVWPEPTHGKPDSLPVRKRKLKPWRTAAECIDWSIPCPSIFERKKPLADATLRRIAKGVMRYVVEAAEPFIVSVTHQGGDRVEPISEPFRTVTGAQRGEKALVVPTLVELAHKDGKGRAGQRVHDVLTPLTTIHAGGGNHALVTAFLAKHFTGVVGSDLRDPIGTVTSVDHHSLVTAMLVTNTTGHPGAPASEPLRTVTTGGHHALVTSNLVKLRGTNIGQPVAEPLHTISAQGMHFAEVRAFLIAYYGTDQDPRLDEPMHTIPTHDRFGLVTVHGVDYAIVDIGLRMLTPRELYRAQGFGDDYIIDRGADGRSMTKTAQIRMVGNSVCPPIAQAIVAANYCERGMAQEAA
jgi:DNA (cytosine-5)-methyltransferase 1